MTHRGRNLPSSCCQDGAQSVLFLVRRSIRPERTNVKLGDFGVFLCAEYKDAPWPTL